MCRCLRRFQKFLRYFGYSQHAAGELKVGTFCKTVSDFALEYRTTRDRVIHQRQKKATQRQRNMTRGKMIVDVSTALNFVCLSVCLFVLGSICLLCTDDDDESKSYVRPLLQLETVTSVLVILSDKQFSFQITTEHRYKMAAA